MICKPEEQSLLQPLHHYISCHRSEPLSLKHLLFCWQLQSSNFSSCSDTISISSVVHGLSERHETRCLCSTAQRLPLKPYRESSTCLSQQNHPWLSITNSSPQLQLSLAFLPAWSMRCTDYFIHVYSTAMRNMHSNSRHLQGSRGAGYRKIPRKLGSTLPAWHPAFLPIGFEYSHLQA